jgi:hypothetical protein
MKFASFVRNVSSKWEQDGFILFVLSRVRGSGRVLDWTIGFICTELK